MTVSLTENRSAHTELLTDGAELKRCVEEVVSCTPVIDIHTHIFPPAFNGMCLFGVDELLTYHYLIPETLRLTAISPANFWQMTRSAQADLIWKTIFVDNSPISEAARGIISVLDAFGLDPRSPDLREARAFFASQDPAEHCDRVLDMARVSELVMTNDPFDDEESIFWKSGASLNGGKIFGGRFRASLRLDSLLNHWPKAVQTLSARGLNIDEQLSETTSVELRRFLDEWIAIMAPLYMAVSLPPEFDFPSDDARGRLIREVVLPVARDHNLSLALMVGVRRGVNPALREAGNGVGRADVTAVERMCAENPDLRFLATFLSLENQHELCVAARKFSNLMPFGCWWFLNNPSLVSQITNERLELLGPSFIPQHSDARVIEHLIYKWQHSRKVIAESLFKAYDRLRESGRAVTHEEIERDVERMFSGNFSEWVGRTDASTNLL